jgi:lipid A 3-O-deacylase
MIKHLIACFLSALFIFGLHAQAIDNTLLYRNIPGDKYFRINYENDFFSASDRDYTQGILVEKVTPDFKRFPGMKILWHPSGSELKYGMAIEHDAYTPNLIDKYKIQYGDRPYAGVLLYKLFLISTDSLRNQLISATFSLGVVGQAAGGEQIQSTIHHWINYTQPQGWHNQIQNDLALNYQVDFEKQLYKAGHCFLLSGYLSGRVGTLSDKLSGGLTAMLGNFRSPFAGSGNENRKFQWYLYDQIGGNAIAYDATLQGGVVNHSSVYVIPSSGISRSTVQNKFGIVLVFKSVFLEYYHTGLTEEFSTSWYHRTGGLQIGFGF